MSINNYPITGETYCKSLSYNNATYATAHDNTSGSVGSSQNCRAGQRIYSASYYIYRTVFGFDTSDIPAAALIKEAYLSLVIQTPTLSGNIVLKSGMPDYPTIPTPVNADYDISKYSGDGGTVDCTGKVQWDILKLYLNDTGKDWINRSGISKFMLISHNDDISEPPTGDEYVAFYGYDVSHALKLTVEYYLPTGIPSIQSVGPCIDIQSTTMTAVGNVTDDGGGYEERGFEYYEDATSYASEMYAVRELGVFTGTGNFEMTIYGLKPETTYQIRAWVRNSYGTAYGEWYTCTTKAVPGYSIYEEVNTATICFYLSEDDGKTWGQKHGPYTEDQADVEITKLLVRGSGKKKIKFESDVLTGISVSVMVKLDCKAR